MGHPFKLLALTTVLISTSVAAQDWGIGFRLGDPSGLTVKHYWNAKAFEVSVGRTQFFSGDRYYNREYDRWYDRGDFNYADHEYIAYGRSAPIAVQLHYLLQKPISNAQGLSWYYGFGAQLRMDSYLFSYRYKPKKENDWIYVYDERVNSVDVGADGVLGLEYNFPKAPVSIFLDATLFMEVVNDPFIFALQGGTGVRFRF
ncbi:MAG: hypothetical protein ACOH13_09085 [Flavobacteriales bacterium]